MKKIMIMINSLYGGGAEKVLQTLLNNLDYAKYDVTLYSMHPEKYDTSIYPSQVHYKVIFDDRLEAFKQTKAFRLLLTKIKGKIFNYCSSELFYKLYIHEKYDVEIAFIEGESTKIVSGSSNKNSKKYAWVHIDLLRNPWTDFLYKGEKDEVAHYLKFNKILCVSESVRTAFIEKYSFDKERVCVQYNPINRDEIIEKSKIKCNLPEKKRFRIISVGRLVEQKGFDRLVRIAAKLKDDGFKFEVIILGEGPQREVLEKSILDYNLQDCVYLLGFRSNPYTYMDKSDLLVCSSRSEGFSTVISEGLVLGLPVVSTDCAGVRELFGSNKCGVITNNDENSLYEALYEVLRNPYYLKSCQVEALKRGESFSLSKTMKDIERLLD